MTSCRLAFVRMTLTGMHCASTRKWCLLPFLLRSVGFGPLFSPMHSPYRRTVGNDMRKIELVGATQFVQQDAVRLAPYPSLMPGTQTAPASHARAAPISWGSISHGFQDCKTNRMPVSTRRSSSGLRPGWVIRRHLTGDNGWTISHKSSSTSSRAISPRQNNY
jgi:hypothetical protein